MTEILEHLSKLFGHIPVKGVEAFLYNGLKALIVLLLTGLFIRFLDRRLKQKAVKKGLDVDKGVEIYLSSINKIFWFLGFIVAIHFAGIDLSSLFTTGGLFAVAFGFAFKNVAENYIAGFILRTEGIVKHGDIIQFQSGLVRVKSVGLRFTVGRSPEECDILIPNSIFVQQDVSNFTLNDSFRRISTTVGVSYDSDLSKVRDVLEEAGTRVEGCTERPPAVYLTEFGSSSVNYMVCVWTKNPWNGRETKSHLNEVVWWALKDAGIVIAYPQLDLHLPDGLESPTPAGG
ncbi:MAG: mechanosensitive ion channel [Desulfuromonadales bacterium]|nr:mechanosensitive ion channel [Desulfuromonadales bacterium]MDH3808555.1 mechanosensitive ion channel [Desulfuromonadales bacterium]MDH3868184.1 mechanosensitive ion channel [Desulfuromonadales bacterium]MDH3960042.1 mechanosensitive ion channel [Desulfuromonadales bacterium]MDH4025641.1 mechanosensitive ion channel [Desulfuromonadales bacterium]